MDKKTIVLIVLLFCIGVCLFFMGRMSNKPLQETKLSDVSKYTSRIDSLLNSIKDRDLTIAVLYLQVDSLSAIKKQNHKKVNHGIKEIHSFTNASRKRWADSVARANGIR